MQQPDVFRPIKHVGQDEPDLRRPGDLTVRSADKKPLFFIPQMGQGGLGEPPDSGLIALRPGLVSQPAGQCFRLPEGID